MVQGQLWGQDPVQAEGSGVWGELLLAALAPGQQIANPFNSSSFLSEMLGVTFLPGNSGAEISEHRDWEWILCRVCTSPHYQNASCAKENRTGKPSQLSGLKSIANYSPDLKLILLEIVGSRAAVVKFGFVL